MRPNQLWHLDFVHRYINRAKVYTLILQDDCSRYVPVSAVAEGEQAGVVIESFGGLLVPADRYFGRHAEVLVRIQAGLAQDDSDPLGLRGRDTTLFQAVNKDGALEVWCPGQRLLSLPRP
ncbi:MAG TPA: hypothetical protein VNM90_09935 [Haliangium sp.]|nr:hypothetical protein [Haliangium sp.]